MAWNDDTWLYGYSIKQQLLADRIGLDSSIIRSWMRQERQPDDNNICLLAAALLGDAVGIKGNDAIRLEDLSAAYTEVIRREANKLRTRIEVHLGLKKLLAARLADRVRLDEIEIEVSTLSELPCAAMLNGHPDDVKRFALALFILAETLNVDLGQTLSWTCFEEAIALPKFAELKADITKLAELQHENLKRIESIHQQTQALEVRCTELKIAFKGIEACSPALDTVLMQLDELCGVTRGASARYLQVAIYIGSEEPIEKKIRSIQKIVLDGIENANGEEARKCHDALELLAEAMVLFWLKGDIDPESLNSTQLVEASSDRGVYIRALLDAALPGVERLTHCHEDRGRLELDMGYSHQLPPGKSNNPAYRVRTALQELAHGASYLKYEAPTLTDGRDLEAFANCPDSRHLNRMIGSRDDSSDHLFVFSPTPEGSDVAEALVTARLTNVRIVNPALPQANSARLDLEDRYGRLEDFLVTVKQNLHSNTEENRNMGDRNFGDVQNLNYIESNNGSAVQGPNSGTVATQQNGADIQELKNLFSEFHSLSAEAIELVPDLKEPVEQIERDLAVGNTPDKETARTLRDHIDTVDAAVKTTDKAMSVGGRVLDPGYKVADKIDHLLQLAG